MQTILNLWHENGTLSMIIQISNYAAANKTTYNTKKFKI